MATEIYGASDDLIEIDGDQRGEVGFYQSDDDASPALVVCSDGTVMTIRYGKGKLAIWAIDVIRPGELLERVDECRDEDADRYSDTAHFRDGLLWVHVATEWERAQ